MLNAAFLLFILGCILYLLLSPRKEAALFVILHAFLQYVITLALWIFHMNSMLAALMLGFIVMSTGLLIWARSLNYSAEQQGIRRFLGVSQWVLLGVIALFILIKSPYYYLIPSSNWHAHINPHLMSIHPLVKISANAFLFSTFFLVILQWGQRWNIRQSLMLLGPMVLYFVLVVLLRFFQSATHTFPLT